MPQDPPTPPGGRNLAWLRVRGKLRRGASAASLFHQKLGVFGRSCASGNLRNLFILAGPLLMENLRQSLLLDTHIVERDWTPHSS